jgi:acyl-CoA synthetase (AMP-forming)/AMP-acid ligase II
VDREMLETAPGFDKDNWPDVQDREFAKMVLLFYDRLMKEFSRGKIAYYKIPRYIKFVTEFPMTVTGKVQKFRCGR